MEERVPPADNPTRLSFSGAQRSIITVPSAGIRDTINTLFDITPLSSNLNAGFHRSRHWYAEQCIFTQLEADAFAVRRTKSHLANGENLVFVHRYLEGYLRGRIGDLNIDREPGYVYILDQATNVECVQRPSTMQTVVIPKSALGFDPDKHPPLTKFPISYGLGHVLNALFDQVFEELLSDNSVGLAVFHQLIACLRLGLGASPDESDLRKQARDAMRNAIAVFVERNLERWDLTVAKILKNFGVSRASLYRIFEDRGGVRQYISDRRLLRAVLDISQGPLLRGEISAAAERWGFSSAANFNRAIRNEFGVPPGSLISLPDDDSIRLASKRDRHAFRQISGRSIQRIVRSNPFVPA